MNELRQLWSKLFKFDYVFALFLVLLICIPRFMLVMDANVTANYSKIGIIMFVSALAPFIFLTKYGRKKIGLVMPKRKIYLLYAFVAGIAFSLLLYYIGKTLYGSELQNWYVYIGKSYNIPANAGDNDKLILFGIMAFTGMIFSPIGEELFFRGIVHASFANSFGDKKASVFDSLAFALTHIAHFGLVYINNKWTFFLLPTLLWVSGMFIASLLFFAFKKQTGSLIGAVLCHSGFNLGMTYAIFYLL